MKCLKVFLILLCGGSVLGSLNVKDDPSVSQDSWKKFPFEYLNYYETGRKSRFLDHFMENIKFSREAKAEKIGNKLRNSQDFTCVLCNVCLQAILLYMAFGATNAQVGDLAFSLCTKLKFQNDYVCRGLVDINIEPAAFIIRNNPNVTSQFVCGILFQGKGCKINGNKIPDWSINIDPNGPPINGSKSLTSSASESFLTIVHISDIHYDPKYEAGALANCGAPVCCRFDQGKPKHPKGGAGFWGDYRNCDSPWEAVWNVFTQINKTHSNINYIYYTGDTVDHGVWETTHESNAASIKKVFQALTAAFPGIPVYPVIGNHDSHPFNIFAPDTINDKELSSLKFYSFISDLCGVWLPIEARDTFKENGFYTALVRKGFRIIAINNNECNIYNFWLLYNSIYPPKQLQWLHDTLLKAEANGEKVHILAHIPPGDGTCFNTWAREYRRIVDRFWNTISAQFNGHTHHDEFNIFYSRDRPYDAINVAWNGGSTTAYGFMNPNYQIYTLETDTYQVIDHETWIYNLTEANQNASSTPNWFREYYFSDAYSVKDLSPASLDKLTTSFATNLNLITKYWMHKVKMGDPSLENGCDIHCLSSHLSQIVTTEFGSDNKRLDELLSLFWNTVHKK